MSSTWAAATKTSPGSSAAARPGQVRGIQTFVVHTLDAQHHDEIALFVNNVCSSIAAVMLTRAESAPQPRKLSSAGFTASAGMVTQETPVALHYSSSLPGHLEERR